MVVGVHARVLPTTPAEQLRPAAVREADGNKVTEVRLEAMPSPKELAARGEKWGPYRTYASLYLWKIADLASEAKAATPRSQE